MKDLRGTPHSAWCSFRQAVDPQVAQYAGESLRAAFMAGASWAAARIDVQAKQTLQAAMKELDRANKRACE